MNLANIESSPFIPRFRTQSSLFTVFLYQHIPFFLLSQTAPGEGLYHFQSKTQQVTLPQTKLAHFNNYHLELLVCLNTPTHPKPHRKT